MEYISNDQEKKKEDAIALLCSYMKEVLEIKKEEFGNLPACPFVKKERINKKIKYQDCVLLNTEECVYQIKKIVQKHFYEDGLEKESTLLLFDLEHSTEEIEINDFLELASLLSKAMKERGIVAIALHPKDNFSVAGIETRKIPLPTLLVQRKEQIKQAKQVLENTQYYNNWKKVDIDSNYTEIGQFLD